MTNENYQIAMAEVLEYLKGIQKEDVEKISPSFMNFLKENASKNYKANFDYTKPLSELQLSDTSKAIISFICYKYWCNNEQQKMKFYNLLKHNDELYKRKWKEKSNNMFKSKEKNIAVTDLQIEKNNKINLWKTIKKFLKNIIKTRR